MTLLNHNFIKKGSLVFLMLACFLALLIDPISIDAQSIFSKNPKSDSNGDEKLCESTEGKLRDDRYCQYYREYKKSDTDSTKPARDSAKKYRNKMLYLVKEQIDDYYDSHKNGRRVKKKWFQTVLDVLGISAALAATISNGERAKSVIAASLGSFQAGRNSINKRFQFLQFQILINKMNANRLEQWYKILEYSQKDIDEYPWDAARVDLQQYLFRGTFNDALDTLVIETGAEVQTAQKKIDIIGEIPKNQSEILRNNFDDYIFPMQTRLDKLFTDIEKVEGEIEELKRTEKSTEEKDKELKNLNSQKANLMKNYESLWLAIVLNIDFETIEKGILSNPKRGKSAKDRFSVFISKVKKKESIPIKKGDDNPYDIYLGYVSNFVRTDTKLNENFLKILEKYKVQ